MAKNKTTETQGSVTDFLNSVEDEAKRNDSFRLVTLLQDQTGFEPKMWGEKIIGFGSYHYRYESGREGDAPLTGFSPRKDAIALYLNPVFENKEVLLQKLGKHKTGTGCVYIKKLDDVEENILKEMILSSIKEIRSMYPATM